MYICIWGFPGGSDCKESTCSAEDPGSIPGSWRSPGEGNGNPFQYLCLENPMDRAAWLRSMGSQRVRHDWVTSLHFIYVSGDSLVAQTVKNPPTMQETQVQSLGQEDPLEKEMTTHSSIPAWRIPWTEQPDRHGPWGCKELDTFQRLSLSLVCVCVYICRTTFCPLL